MTTGRINQVTILNGGPQRAPRYPLMQAEQFTVALSGQRPRSVFSVAAVYYIRCPYARVNSEFRGARLRH